MWKKTRNFIVPFFLILVSLFISYLLYEKYCIGKPVDDSDLITHYGVFLGFGLTIYTFVISILDNITKRIDGNSKIKNKELIVDGVFAGVKHLKQDVFAIFVIFVMQIILMFFEVAISEFLSYILIIKHGLFIFSLIILYDVCSVLFGIAEISLSLLKNRKNEQQE